jgi:hypothetical protein
VLWSDNRTPFLMQRGGVSLMLCNLCSFKIVDSGKKSKLLDWGGQPQYIVNLLTKKVIFIL